MKSLLTFDRFPSVGRGFEFLGWVEQNYGHAAMNDLSCIPLTLHYTLL